MKQLLKRHVQPLPLWRAAPLGRSALDGALGSFGVVRCRPRAVAETFRPVVPEASALFGLSMCFLVFAVVSGIKENAKFQQHLAAAPPASSFASPPGPKSGAGASHAQIPATAITALAPPAVIAPESIAVLPFLGPPVESVAVIEREFEGPSQRTRACALDEPLDDLAADPQPLMPKGAAFGTVLAAAARAQTRNFVVYTDAYRTLAYPNGDVSALFGVCTDVVIRAYRALGVDLQALVHQARGGDKNIDHRRTETLRRFFAASGASLPPTDFAEDYLAGDVVTYERPQNRQSNAHIAIVSDVVGPSGRPMIVHNRGWGPQIEDALFVDTISGHYRYSGPGDVQSKAPDVPSARKAVARPRAAHRVVRKPKVARTALKKELPVRRLGTDK